MAAKHVNWSFTQRYCYDFFLFPFTSYALIPLFLFWNLHITPLEHLLPKYSFLHYLQYIAPLSHFLFPLTDVPHPTCCLIQPPSMIYYIARISTYIFLGSCAINIIWSVCCISTYLNRWLYMYFLNFDLLNSTLYSSDPPEFSSYSWVGSPS